MPTLESAERSVGQLAVLESFGLREQPFGVSPDPRFLYLTASHREALASLVYGIESKRGFTALVAEPGMGKTTLLFYLLEKLKSTARTAFLFRPDSNTKELLESLLLDLGLDANPDDVPQMHETLKSALLEDLHAGKHFVWVIDEAQDLGPQVLEAVRLLSNFETPASKLMHILLAGQPGLSEKLVAPELLQLRQRISSFVQLQPLSESEVAEYIGYRIRRAGGRVDEIFSREAQRLIAQASRGIPRNINSLCFSCLSLGFAESRRYIGPPIVEAVLAEHEPAPQTTAQETPPPPSNPWLSDILNANLAADFPNPAPRHHGRSAILFVVGLVILPFLLIVFESNPRFGVLDSIHGPLVETVVARVTGYDIHSPTLPDLPSPALQPPKPPVPLPEVQRVSIEQTPVINNIGLKETGTASNEPASKFTAAQEPARKEKAITRVIFAHRGDTLYQVARKYYGRSNGIVVSQIRSHNPQIRDLDTVLQENQPIVIPDLSPEFPWKLTARGDSGY